MQKAKSDRRRALWTTIPVYAGQRIAVEQPELSQLSQLLQSIRSDDLDMIERIVRQGVPNIVDYVHPESETTLGLAAALNKEETVAFLIGLGANVNVVDTWRRSAAIRAAEFGNVQSLRVLAHAGIDMRLVDDQGKGKALQGAFEIYSERLRFG